MTTKIMITFHLCIQFLSQALQLSKTVKMVMTVMLSLTSSIGGAVQLPNVSSELESVIAKQLSRAVDGNKDTSSFRSDLELLVKKNDPVAKFLLASFIVKEDREKAKRLALSSASSGCPGAAGLLGTMLLAENKIEQGRMWLNFAIDNGDAGAMFYNAAHYVKSANDSDKEKNRIQRMIWLKMAESRTYSSSLWLTAALAITNMQESSAQEKAEIDEALSQLMKTIPQVRYHPCGQSFPGNDRDFEKQRISRHKQKAKIKIH